MFKNRSMQIKVVKDNSNAAETTSIFPHLNEAEINLIKSSAKNVGIYLVLTAVTLKFSDAICEIAVNLAPKN